MLTHALFLPGLVLLAFGFWLTPIAAAMPLRHFEELVGFAAGAGLLGIGLARLARLRLAEGLLLALLLFHLFFVGSAAFLATLALASGALAFGLRWQAGARDPALALLIGLALLAGLSGWLLPIRLHLSALYLALLAFLVWRARAMLPDALERLLAGFRRQVAKAPGAAAVAMLALFAASVGSWLPTMQHDDLAYHLGLPHELSELGYYRMDASSQIWALAPWSADVLQGIAQLLAGTEARGSLNLLWLFLGAWFLAVLVRRLGGGSALAWWAVALWASQPLLAFLTGGMQTELPAMAALLAAAGILLGPPARLRSRDTLAVLAILGGFLLGLKASHLITVGVLGLWLVVRLSGHIPWGETLRPLLLLVLCGGSSYAYAAWLTGNPVFPLFNAFFRSPDFPAENFRDLRYGRGLGLSQPWALTFDTGRFFEGEPGAAGFALLGLIGLLPLALLRRRTRAATCVAFAIILLTFWPMNYLRYLLPALALLLATKLAALRRLRGKAAALALGVLVALQLLFQGSSWWVFQHDALGKLRDDPGGGEVLARFASERLLVSHLDPRHRVLYLGRPSHAELAGRGFTLGHYDPKLSADPRWNEPPTSGRDPLIEAAWDHGITHLLLAGHPDPAALGARIRAQGGKPVSWVYDSQLWALPLAPDHPRRDLRKARDRAKNLRRVWR